MGIKEEIVRVDDWMSFGSDMIDGNSFDCMNEGEFGSVVRITYDVV